jgi:DeoR/GlpR family transcriptional regulator of sugar metabolism
MDSRTSHDHDIRQQHGYYQHQKTSWSTRMTQDELKKMVAEAALEYVEPGTVIGIGTGSTAKNSPFTLMAQMNPTSICT